MPITLNGTTGITAPTYAGTVVAEYSVPVTAFKNRLINGGMQVWQRGTTSGSAGYQTADRWYGNASNSTTFAQETSNVPAGFQNAFKMTAGATAQMWIQQPIETRNCYDLRGQTVTVSFLGAASTTTNVTLFLYFSTSADNPAAGSWTPVSSAAFSVGTSYATYTATFTVPSNALTIMPQIITTSTVVSGTIIYITGVQLEKGSNATSFDYRPYGTELALCQRYFQATGNTIYTGSQSGGNLNFPIQPIVAFRAIPTVTIDPSITNANYVAAGPSANQWTLLQSNVAFASKTGIVIITPLASLNMAVFVLSNATWSVAVNQITTGNTNIATLSAEL
jgi:hypothetical protein